MTLTALDLYCGGGGAGMGYHRAGFDVTGVDHRPQPRYPFAFIQADAIDYCREHGHEYDFIHASPPCQEYTTLRALQGDKEYPDLVAATRTALIATGKPYVIENVPGAPLIAPAMLCGRMFGLPLYRHRMFECSFFFLTPAHAPHDERATGSKGWGRKSAATIQTVTGFNYILAKGKAAMGIDWMTRRELSQAIPPKYTEFIGRSFLAAEAHGQYVFGSDEAEFVFGGERPLQPS